MIDSYEFYKSVVDSITEHLVVIDREGWIQFVNRAWIEFGCNNDCTIRKNWQGVNYLHVCNCAAVAGEDDGDQAAQGIMKVIRGELDLFYFEYPCHSSTENRWFMMRITPFQFGNMPFFVITHQNITERKLAEEAVANLSRLDGLTNVPNRRYFDEFLRSEWRRCARLQLPLSLAMIDIDHFKMLNDTYGHQSGDECLKKIGEILKTFSNRPGDICARYGGEEFALVLGNTTLKQSVGVVQKLLNAIRELQIPNKNSPTKPTVTVSIGLAMKYPDNRSAESDLIREADRLLYSAKMNGRNRIVYQ